MRVLFATCRRSYWCYGMMIFAFLASSASFGAPGKRINLCNDSDRKIYFAVAYESQAGAQLMARGWWNAEPQKCSELELPIGTDRFLVYANSENNLFEWNGDVPLCVDINDKFDFSGAASMACNTGNLATRGFREFSMNSLTSSSNGQVPSVSFKLDDAIKIGAELKICNDANESAYIAYAQNKQGVHSIGVVGWYKIDAGKCYEAIRQPSADELYLFANTEGFLKSWKGDVALCTNQYEAFTFEDAAAKSCMGNNERRHLFKKIMMTGTGDFEYRLQERDAVEPRSVIRLCNTRSEKISVVLAFEDPDFSGQYIASGWYGIEPQTCKIEKFAIGAESVKVHVENDAGDVLRSGVFKACIHGSEAFEYGNATAMTCTDEGQGIESFDVIALGLGTTTINLP